MKTITKTISMITLAIGVLLSTNAVAQCSGNPATPGPITGPTALCLMSNATYTVDSVPGATSYTWTVPSGTTGLSINLGQGTNSITCHVSAGTVSGNVTCTYTDGCGTSAASVLAVDKKPAVPGIITSTAACGGSSGTFSIAPVQGANSYTWTAPNGVTITSGNGTTSVNASIASTFITGNLHVMSVNGCGSLLGGGAVLTLVQKVPPSPAPISGPNNACNLTTANYLTLGSSGATSYTWAVTGQNASVSSSTTNNTTVNFLSTLTTTTLSVVANNACGSSNSKSFVINKFEPTPGAITANPSVWCAGFPVEFTTSGTAGATSYAWTLPSGNVLITGQGTSDINTSWAGSNGIVSVKAFGSCGASAATNFTTSVSCMPTNNNNNNKSMTISPSGEIGFSMYPNPAESEFTIDVNTLVDNNIIVEVYDITGNKVAQQKYPVAAGESSIKTNIGEYQTGMYFVRVLDMDNNSLFNQTIVKK